jgi:hypothetical protein
MTINQLNKIISNNESRDLPIEIIVNNAIYRINSIVTDSDKKVLRFYATVEGGA